MKRLWIAVAAAACLVPAGCRWFEPEPATVPYCPPGYTPYYYQPQPSYYYQSGQSCPPGYVPTTQCLPATTVAPARAGTPAPVPAAAPSYTPPPYSPGIPSYSPGAQPVLPSGGTRQVP